MQRSPSLAQRWAVSVNHSSGQTSDPSPVTDRSRSPPQEPPKTQRIPIDITNTTFVGVAGKDIVVQCPRARMTKHEALVHAAYIVALACDDVAWDAILDAVQNS